jgi:hypothetical protein
VQKTGGAHSPFLFLLVVARMSLGLSGAGLGTPSPRANARPREGVPGSTDHGLEKPAGGGVLPGGRPGGRVLGHAGDEF